MFTYLCILFHRLQFSFVLQLNRYWEMNRILIAEENVTFTTNVYAPVGFSYHCGKTLFKTAQDQTVFKLSIPGFQVYIFSVLNKDHNIQIFNLKEHKNDLTLLPQYLKGLTLFINNINFINLLL